MLSSIQSNISPQTITWLIGVLIVGIATFIQGLPVKYNPWSWLFNQIGKAINKDVLEEISNIKNTVDGLQEKIKEQELEDEKEKALAARRRILRFADECRVKQKHSKEYFDNILEDISFYKKYCDDNPKFKNEKAVFAIMTVENAYKHAYDTNDFL